MKKKVVKVNGCEYLVMCFIGDLMIAPAVRLSNGSYMWVPGEEVTVIPLDSDVMEIWESPELLRRVVAMAMIPFEGASVDVWVV